MKYLHSLVTALLFWTASTASAHCQDRVILPAEVEYPEGIAHDPARNMLFVAGTGSGQIARIDLSSRHVRLIGSGFADQIGAARPGILGMKIDSQGRLWIAGGKTGKLFVVNANSGAILSVVTTPGEGGLINDVAFAKGRAFFTDTLRPHLWSVDMSGEKPSEPELWLDMTNSPAHGSAPFFNGIVATPDGRALIAAHMGKGQLFRIDTDTRKLMPIDLGGETVTGADGLVLDGTTLYIIRQPVAEIVTITLSLDHMSGKVIARTASPGLQWPATAAKVGDSLYIVNTQFNAMGANRGVRPFSIEKVSIASLHPH